MLVASLRQDQAMTYSSGGKVLADDRNTGREQAAGAQAQAKTLGKENLPVLGGEAGHHHAKTDKKTPRLVTW